jgi:two-component system, NarL family, sensor kinase
MHFKKSLSSGILLLLLFSGCNDRQKISGNNESARDKPLLDSIKKLDSLSSSLRDRNDSLSLAFASRALNLAKSINAPVSLVKAYTAVGYFYHTRHPDSAFYYYNTALKLADSLHDIKLKPRLLYNIAMVYNSAFDKKGAMILLDSCINIARKTDDFFSLSNAYNSMGLIHQEIRDTSIAKELFEKALRTGKEHALPKQVATAICNLASFEKDVKKSIAIQKSALAELMKQPGNEEFLVQAYINIGILEPNPDSAIFYYTSALNYAKNGNYIVVEISAYNNLVYSYLDKGDIVKANECIELAIPLAKKTKNYDWLSTLYDSYADVLAQKGDFSGAFKALRKSMGIRSRMEFSKNEEQIRLLSAILDLKNKEIMIKENASELKEKNTQNQILKLTIIISFLLIVAILFLFIAFRQRALNRIKHQQILSARRIIELEETEKSRIGFELHDNIGYLVRGINGFIKSLEISDVQIKIGLHDRMNELSESIRRISHRMSLVKDDHSNLQEMVSDIINDMTRLTGINIQYYIPARLPVFSKETDLHVCRIIQELLTNAAKHANGSDIRIDVAFAANNLLLIYTDNGPGFNAEVTDPSGIGLKSITERITLLNGKCELQTSPGKGTKWEISIPFSAPP